MLCHVCQAEAVGRCYECGRLYCAAHDVNGNCSGCATAIYVSTNDKVSTRAMPSGTTKAWWRPQVEEDDTGQPSCYQCGGLANRICRNCTNLYCPEHGRGAGLCAGCARSSWMALWIIFGVLALLGATLILTMMVG